MKIDKCKQWISFGALGLIVIHLFWPRLGIDAVTIALLSFAAIPWLGPIIKELLDSGIRNIELPGGIKIGLADVKSATDKVTTGRMEGVIPPLKVTITDTLTGHDTKSELCQPTRFDDPAAYFQEIANTDPNLALVAFRVEIEKSLRTIAETRGINTKRIQLNQLARLLQENQIVPQNMANGLMELIAMGNRAAHGVEVSQDAAAWVLDIGPSIIIELDRIGKSGRAQNKLNRPDV